MWEFYKLLRQLVAVITVTEGRASFQRRAFYGLKDMRGRHLFAFEIQNKASGFVYFNDN